MAYDLSWLAMLDLQVIGGMQPKDETVLSCDALCYLDVLGIDIPLGGGEGGVETTGNTPGEGGAAPA